MESKFCVWTNVIKKEEKNKRNQQVISTWKYNFKLCHRKIKSPASPVMTGSIVLFFMKIEKNSANFSLLWAEQLNEVGQYQQTCHQTCKYLLPPLHVSGLNTINKKHEQTCHHTCNYVLPPVGLEPTTFGPMDQRSADWAMGVHSNKCEVSQCHETTATNDANKWIYM